MGLFDLLKIIRKYVLGFDLDFSVGSYENLDLLIKRAVKRMGRDIFCPFCGSKLEFRSSRLQGGGIGNAPIGTPIHDDQQWKCTNCFSAFAFGIPMTKEEAKEEIRVRKGVWLCWTLMRKNERKREDIKRRLKALGYIDFEM